MKYKIRKTRCVPEIGFRARKSKGHMDLFLKCAELEKCRCVPKIGFRAAQKILQFWPPKTKSLQKKVIRGPALQNFVVYLKVAAGQASQRYT